MVPVIARAIPGIAYHPESFTGSPKIAGKSGKVPISLRDRKRALPIGSALDLNTISAGPAKISQGAFYASCWIFVKGHFDRAILTGDL